MVSALRAAGIPATIPEYNHAQMNWLTVQALNGVQVMTPAYAADDAHAYLAEIEHAGKAAMADDEPVERTWRRFVKPWAIILFFMPHFLALGLLIAYLEWRKTPEEGNPG